MSTAEHGVVNHKESDRRSDYLYRLSLKCFITNESGEVLVVKESGRDWWDLPGGGLDHGEDIEESIARELKEEVNYDGDFKYIIIHVDEPKYLEHGFWQVRLIFKVVPDSFNFSVGSEADEICFMTPEFFKNAKRNVEQSIYNYSQLA